MEELLPIRAVTLVNSIAYLLFSSLVSYDQNDLSGIYFFAFPADSLVFNKRFLWFVYFSVMFELSTSFFLSQSQCFKSRPVSLPMFPVAPVIKICLIRQRYKSLRFGAKTMTLSAPARYPNWRGEKAPAYRTLASG
jgi:hypothetical protein